MSQYRVERLLSTLVHIREVLASNIDPTSGRSLMTEVSVTLLCALTQMSTSTVLSGLTTCCLSFSVHCAAVSDWTLCGVPSLLYLTNIAGHSVPLFQSVCERPLSYLRFIRWASRQEAPRTQHDCHHDTKVRPGAVTAVIELLMMGGKTPETCWVVNKRQDNKLENCCIWLVIYLN